jgi:Transposase DDE domain.
LGSIRGDGVRAAADAGSLREISLGLASASGKLRHLGIDSAPCRSTLSYANAKRPWQFFEDLFAAIYAMASAEAARHRKKFRLKKPLYALDSTTISLCVNVFDWALYRQTKGAVKVHLLLDRQGCLPCWAMVTEGKRADVTVARTLELPAGSIVAMDRGYNDYSLFGEWCERGVYFVTRMKEGALYETVNEREVPAGANAESDEVIRLTGAGAGKACPYELRRVVVWDEKSERPIALLTNHPALAASTIGRIYRERWKIELFFKALKQNLRVKTFLGTTENAVQTQIWTALIVILLIKYLQMRSRWPWSMSNLIAAFRVCMFAHKDLWDWLNDPTAKKGAEAATRLRVVLWLAFWTAGLGIRENSEFKNRGHVLKKAVLEKRMRVFTGIQRGEAGNGNYFGQ